MIYFIYIRLKTCHSIIIFKCINQLQRGRETGKEAGRKADRERDWQGGKEAGWTAGRERGTQGRGGGEGDWKGRGGGEEEGGRGRGGRKGRGRKTIQWFNSLPPCLPPSLPSSLPSSSLDLKIFYPHVIILENAIEYSNSILFVLNS